jgi:hypothetical protein
MMTDVVSSGIKLGWVKNLGFRKAAQDLEM